MIEEVKGEVQRKIDEVEGKVQRKIEEVKSKVQDEIEEKKSEVQRKIAASRRGLVILKLHQIISQSRALTFDRQTSETVFKTQLDVVSSTNGWTDFVKANQLVATLRGSEAEVLQGIPTDKLTNLTTFEKALKSGFGDNHLVQLYGIELKTRRKKPGESLQVLAANVARLMSLAYAECSQDVREFLVAQYFVDTIRDEDTQQSTRLVDAKDLKSALAYSMKYEAAKTISKTSRHVRLIEMENDISRERDYINFNIFSTGWKNY
ncbi:hypothetical protein AVEN_144168-1 [Araneus ventricosus]|uniref:Uncharacterized protein n=1 Tax=Araneus ventricosus TaxID=182803 RepID=A0A4Y2GD95_ARAVE|nr:hypothetical protein AVEN_144168-1 [Araneus ventricosus]